MFDAHKLGWDVPASSHDVKFSWPRLTETVSNYIKSLNWGYKTQLKAQGITVFKALASFVDPHTIQFEKSKKTERVSGKYIVLAMGGRPKIPSSVSGAEFAITSDDIFWRKTPPGKTLCVGASYISLETAGFLHAMGYDTTVCVRSILLRGFDEDCSAFIGQHMRDIGVKFKMGASPIKLEKLDDGKIRVTFKSSAQGNAEEENEKKSNMEIYDTVLFATGRAPETGNLGLDIAGVKLDEQSGKIRASKEQTSAAHIYAVGDIVYGAPELTPVAIQAGKLLARRLFLGADNWMDYHMVPTTVFTPCEYGCVGYSEEEAMDVFGEEKLRVYVLKNNPLETWSVKRTGADGQELSSTLFFKVVCVDEKEKGEKVVGLHYVGPNAGEVMQGFGLALRLGCTKADLDDLVGIHPTCAEWFTTMTVLKGSGEEVEAEGC